MFTALSSAATYRVCAAADAGAGARASNKNKQHATTAPSALYSHRRWGFSGAGAGAAREAIHTRAAGSDAAPAIAPAHLRTTVTPVPPEIMAEGKGRFLICPHTCPRPSFQQELFPRTTETLRRSTVPNPPKSLLNGTSMKTSNSLTTASLRANANADAAACCISVIVTRRISLRDGGMDIGAQPGICLLYTSPSPRDATLSRMPSSA